MTCRAPTQSTSAVLTYPSTCVTPSYESITKFVRNRWRETRMNSPSISSPQRTLGTHRLHRLDPADRIDLVGVVPSVRLFQGVEHRAKPRPGVPEQSEVSRRRGQRHEREHRAVDEHQHECDDQLHRGAQPAYRVLDEKVAHLRHAGEPPQDVPRAARGEVFHREREQRAGQVVERRRVEPDRDPNSERYRCTREAPSESASTENMPMTTTRSSSRSDSTSTRSTITCEKTGSDDLKRRDQGGETERTEQEAACAAEEVARARRQSRRLTPAARRTLPCSRRGPRSPTTSPRTPRARALRRPTPGSSDASAFPWARPSPARSNGSRPNARSRAAASDPEAAPCST